GLLELGERKHVFAGLEDACQAVKQRFPFITVLSQSRDPDKGEIEDAIKTYELFGHFGTEAEQAAEKLLERTADDEQLVYHAEHLVNRGECFDHNGLGNSSQPARLSLVERMREDRAKGLVSIRVHYGEPPDFYDHMPWMHKTLIGIERLAESELISLISLGTSRDTQVGPYKDKADWNRNDDGGVVVTCPEDMNQLFAATQRGNFPAIKLYAGTGFPYLLLFNHDQVMLMKLQRGMQAVSVSGPWFGEFDKRGPLEPLECMRAKRALVDMLMSFDEPNTIPIEINEPHHWSLRMGDDIGYVTAHAVAAAFANICGKNRTGIDEYIAQFMFNTPKTASWADYAKMSAAIEIAGQVRKGNMWVETRAGLPYFRPDPQKSLVQLVTTTILQSYFNPWLMHVVSDCEARRAAKPDDVERSVKAALSAYEYFNQNRQLFPDFRNDQKVQERKEYLKKNAALRLTAMARLGSYMGDNILDDMQFRLDDFVCPEVIDTAMRRGILFAPGILEKKSYENARMFMTGVFDSGYDAIDLHSMQRLDEQTRLARVVPELV
ncbi:hypothetical protein KY320_03605, partial [Candidatus Woesearchaeota archaeon]|nr:hypothetical protein [Candidatus Woesearchaeota archaeon]